MVFKVICLLFYIVDMFLTVIDVTRSFIISRCKIGGGNNVKLPGLFSREISSKSSIIQDDSGSNSLVAVVVYLAALYYMWGPGGEGEHDRGQHVRDGITDWGRYPK